MMITVSSDTCTTPSGTQKAAVKGASGSDSGSGSGSARVGSVGDP